MTTGDIILHIFCLVDDALPYIAIHPQAKLYPSELVTIGILFSLKGGYFRAFYRWLERDYGDWFGQGELPERTRLQRLLKTHQDWCDMLLAEATFFTVIDTLRSNCSFQFEKDAANSRLVRKTKTKVAGALASNYAGCSMKLVE